MTIRTATLIGKTCEGKRLSRYLPRVLMPIVTPACALTITSGIFSKPTSIPSALSVRVPNHTSNVEEWPNTTSSRTRSATTMTQKPRLPQAMAPQLSNQSYGNTSRHWPPFCSSASSSPSWPSYLPTTTSFPPRQPLQKTSPS